MGWQPHEVVEDAQTVSDAATRWNDAENLPSQSPAAGLLPTDLGNPDTLYINNLGAAGTNSVSPIAVAQSVNPLAAQFFADFAVTRTTGIVAIDTTGMTGLGNDNDLIGEIINENNVPIMVTSSSDAPGATGTLRDAINLANSQLGVNTIEFASTVQSIMLQADLPTITSDLDIVGTVDIDANGYQTFQNPANHNVTELDVAASDNGPAADQISTDTAPIFVNLSAGTLPNQPAYVVNVATDSPAGTGSGSTGDLRYCVTQADKDVAAGSSATITFASSLDGQTITLENGPLELKAGSAGATITINGANQVAVSGGGNVGVFQVETGAAAVLTGLTIEDGASGGIMNDGTLTVSNCTVSGNSGGGIDNAGTGTLAVSNTTLSGNSTAYGGGILNNGSSVSVSDCTLSGNSASGLGGTIFNASGTLVVESSTLFDNTASQSGGGIINNGGTMAVLSSTLSGNSVSGSGGQGGGITNIGTMVLCDTIVAGNLAKGGATGPDISGLVSASVTIGGVTYTEGYNLIGNGTGSAGFVSGVNGDQVGTSNNPINAELGPLQNYGGPTQTMALLPGSPARGAGDPSAANLPATDQRGFSRVVAGTIDIGAVETQAPVVLTVVSDADTGAGSGLAGDLRYCVAQANADLADAIPAVINFAPSLDGQTITLTGSAGPLELKAGSAGATITINGANLVAVSGGGSTSDFQVDTGANVILTGLSIIDGMSSAEAGGIDNAGTLTLSNVTLSGNVGYAGGGIENTGTLTVNNSTLRGNSSADENLSGGAIYNTGTLTLSNSTLWGNSAYAGGGIRNDSGGTLTVTNSTLSGNSGTWGGTINNYGTLILTDSTLSANVATGAAVVGGIYNAGTMALQNSIVAGNTTSSGKASDIAGAGSFTDNGYNLLGTALAASGVKTDVFSDAPGLAPLANNGGPTETMALYSGSPAIGAGDPGAANLPATDQRGQPRTTGGAVDIGAYEHVAVAYAESLDANGNLTITQELAGANDNLSFALSDGNYIFTESGALAFDQPEGAGAGYISGGDTSSITVPSAQLQSISVVLGNGTNVFNFTGSNGASVAPITVNAGTAAGDQVSIDGAVLDSGAVSLSAASIVVNANLTAAGNVNLTANPAGTASGNFVGIDVNGATVESTGGSVMLQGTGGTGTSGSQYGVEIQGGGIIETTGTSGTVTVLGTGGASAAGTSCGVYVTGTGSLVTSGGGNVTVTGTGGDTGTGAFGNDFGVDITLGAAVTAIGNGTVTIAGTGGIGGSGHNDGVLIGTDGSASAVAGGVTIQGKGGTGSGGFNEGVVIDGIVGSGGTGSTLSIQGTGGTGSAGSDVGVEVDVNGTVGSAGGNILVIGTGAASGNDDFGISVANGGNLTAAGSGTLALTGSGGSAGTAAINVQTGGNTLTTDSGSLLLTGDIIDLGDPNSVSTTGAAQLFFQPQTASRPIILGGNDTAGSLVFTDSDLAAIASGWSSITIGSAQSTGSITTAGNLTFNSNVNIQTVGGISLANTLDDSGNTVTLTSGGSISQTAGITAAALSVNAESGITLNSANAVSSFMAVNSTGGAISLTNTAATLVITGIAQNGTAAGSNVTVKNTGNITTKGAITTTAAGNGAITLTASGDETIGANVSTAGNGAISLTAGDSLTINSGDSLTINTIVSAAGNGGISLTSGGGQTISANVSAADSGDVTLTANAAGTTTGNFIGIDVVGATIQSATGSVTLQGTGGTDSGGEQFGVQIQGGGSVQTTGGSGAVMVQGTGGASSGGDNVGVSVAGTGSIITSGGGPVTVQGTGGGTGSVGDNDGVSIEGATVSSGGGAVVVTGTGGSGSGGGNAGVYLSNWVKGKTGVALSAATVAAAGSGTVTIRGQGGAVAGSANDGIDEMAGSTITSGGGNVSLTGQAGGSTAAGSPGSDRGVYIAGTVSSTGSGGVMVTGTGGPGSGGFDLGVWVGGGGTVTSGSTGIVAIQGTGGPSAGGYTVGVFVLDGSVTSGGSGTVSVQGQSGTLPGTFNTGVWVSGSDATVTSGGGAVSVVGHGGGSGAASQNYGVDIELGARVTAGGSGTVTVQGNGGSVLYGPTYGYSVSEAANATPTAVSIATLLGTHYKSADKTTSPGIAVTASSGAGVWQYQSGSAWTNIPAVSPTSALLLPQADQLRFLPTGLDAGAADLLFSAWDGSLGSIGGLANVGNGGGGTPFSATQGMLAVTVTPVVAAPLWLATTTTLTPVLPGSSKPAGQSVQQAFGALFSADGAQSPGIAVVGLTGAGSGTWQYALYNSSTSSVGSFQNLPNVSASSALLLGPHDLIRFVPSSASFVGNVALQVRAWDGTTGTDGATANLSSTTSIGSTTAFSSAILTASVYVNHAPAQKTIPITWAATAENVTSKTASVLSLLKLTQASDVDKGTSLGLALTEAGGPGVWQYQLPQGAWQTVPASLSTASALLLPSAALLRFVPAPDQTGRATLGWCAWDGTQGTSGAQGLTITGTGGATAFSSVSASAVLAVNPSLPAPAPMWSGSGATLTPVVPNTAPTGSTVSSVFGTYFADPKAALGIAVSSVAGTANGTWQYSLNGGKTWGSLNSVSASNAIMLTATDLVRFVPKTNFVGTATLTAHAWAATSSQNGKAVNLALAGKTGAATAYSAATLTASCLVNNAPTLK